MDTPPSLIPQTRRWRFFRELQQRIASGEYPPGSRLPGCRELARQYHLSPVTACAVLKALQESGSIRLIHGHGAYAAPVAPTALPQSLKIIFKPLDCACAIWNFLNAFVRIFRPAGWAVTFRSPLTLAEASAELRKPDGYCVCLGFSFVDFQQLAKTILQDGLQNRVFFLSTDFSAQGIFSILGDEAQLIDMCMRHLAECGCKRIGLTIANSRNRIEMKRVQTWCKYYPKPANQASMLLYLNLPPDFQDDGLKNYSTMLQQPKFQQMLRHLDALICCDANLAIFLAQHLPALGIQIPRDLAIISTDNPSALQFVTPSITAVACKISDHVQTLFRMISAPPKTPLALCSPDCYPRESTMTRCYALQNAGGVTKKM